MKRLKRMLFVTISIFLIGLLITIVFESIMTNNIIKDFKDRGVLVHTQGNQRFYLVKKAHDYEDTSRRILENYDNNNIGTKGDIYLTSRNPVNFSLTVKILSSNIWIGHSALVINNDASQTIEITGNDVDGNNTVRIWENSWYDDLIEDTKEYAVLRVKNTDEDTIDNVVASSREKLGMPYNYSIIFNTKNSFYCTDLVSRVYKENKINIDYDGLISTGADMIMSKHTYLVYYRLRVVEGNEVFYNIYYLGD